MLNGVILEPGYGSEKQGKERGFVTTDELPTAVHLNLLNVAEDGGAPSCGLADGSGTYRGRPVVTADTGDGYGRGVAHQNTPLSIATFAWKRTV